jgi:GT2 family glycosyltransferase
VKISIVFITNSKRIDVLSRCIDSALNVTNDVIVVGNTDLIQQPVIKINDPKLANNGLIAKMRNTGADTATGDIIINADDDIYFPIMFKKKLIKYVKNNPNFGSFTTKVIGINGSRYWDRAVHFDNKSFMIDYDQTHANLYYSGAFIVRQKEFAEKYQWDDSLKYYEKEDVEYSNKIKSLGNSINIDTNNYVIHLDERYISYRNGDGFLVCDKFIEQCNNEVQQKEFREIKAYLK